MRKVSSRASCKEVVFWSEWTEQGSSGLAVSYPTFTLGKRNPAFCGNLPVGVTSILCRSFHTTRTWILVVESYDLGTVQSRKGLFHGTAKGGWSGVKGRTGSHTFTQHRIYTKLETDFEVLLKVCVMLYCETFTPPCMCNQYLIKTCTCVEFREKKKKKAGGW